VLIKVGCGGVDLSFLDPVMLRVIKVVQEVWFGEEPVITSTSEGSHLAWSKHYVGRALDFRWPKSGSRSDLAQAVREHLGRDFDIVDEATHLHVEYDPKGQEG
jgi:hypothetical protein